MLLRSMSQAEYSPDNEGHFGLAFDAYTHFTSPIRRYPDLIVHRVIKAQVADTDLETKDDKKLIKKLYSREKLAEIGQANSITERNADLATRDVTDWLKCEYMQSHIGNHYSGEVSSITNFGLFVRLNEVYVEGLIHVTELGRDYFHYDNTRQQMVGERSGKRFSIGDPVEIEVANVDIDLRRIDFSLIDNGDNQGSTKKLSEREKLYANARAKSKKTSKKNSSRRSSVSESKKAKAGPADKKKGRRKASNTKSKSKSKLGRKK